MNRKKPLLLKQGGNNSKPYLGKIKCILVIRGRILFKLYFPNMHKMIVLRQRSSNLTCSE